MRYTALSLLILAVMALAGCAPPADRPDDNRNSGLYGGVSGGISR